MTKQPSASPAPLQRILVVDDDEAIRRLVSASLVRHGYDAATAADVPEAERMLGERRYDVVMRSMPKAHTTQLQCREPELPA